MLSNLTHSTKWRQQRAAAEIWFSWYVGSDQDYE